MLWLFLFVLGIVGVLVAAGGRSAGGSGRSRKPNRITPESFDSWLRTRDLRTSCTSSFVVGNGALVRDGITKIVRNAWRRSTFDFGVVKRSRKLLGEQALIWPAFDNWKPQVTDLPSGTFSDFREDPEMYKIEAYAGDLYALFVVAAQLQEGHAVGLETISWMCKPGTCCPSCDRLHGTKMAIREFLAVFPPHPCCRAMIAFLRD